MLDAVITGASGFIGRALDRRLRESGRQVLSVSRKDGDVLDPDFWNRLPPARTVVHLAGRSYVPDSWKVPSEYILSNIATTQYALDWCRTHGARMVLASAYVYGIPSRLPIRETDPVRPNNPYALSKRLCEQCCEFAFQYQGINATVLRIFNVFGPGQRDEFLIPTLSRQLAGREIRVMDLVPRRDYVYLHDVVTAFERALDSPTGFHVLNIGSGQSYSVADIVELLQSAAGTRLPVVSEGQPRQHEIPDVRADITLARQVLGWRPEFDLARGLKEMLNRD